MPARLTPWWRAMRPPYGSFLSANGTPYSGTLAAKPRDDVWLFGYGSLIWNPTVDFVKRRVARATGWHRAFCLATPAARGSLDNPGLVLGLDAGGCCDGVAFRISGEIVESEFAMLWKREKILFGQTATNLP
jgi:cation transport protein ChaC